MQPPHQHSRINLAELKTQIVRKLGPEGSKQYFYYLQRFLSLKLNKVEFDKLCLRILGRENVPLHNQFIRSILRNACSAKSPPQAGYRDGVFEHGAQVGVEGTSADNHLQNGSHNNMAHTSCSPNLSNGGDMLPVSPRKTRSIIRDRRSGDRRSALGPNGKTGTDFHLPSVTQSGELNVIVENGGSHQPDIGRAGQQNQDHMRYAENEREIPVPHSAKMPILMRPSDGSAPVHSEDQNELLVRNDREDASVRSLLQAPLGVPFCPVSIGGARGAVPSASYSGFVGLIDNTLLDSHTLRERVEHIAVAQGLEGVSLECANILNHGLDSYIKGLVKSCIELAGARSKQDLVKNKAQKLENHQKLVNGVKPGHQFQIQNSGAHLQLPEQKLDCPISLQDFRAAMELNPRQLGEDWPLLLEKIVTRSFDE